MRGEMNLDFITENWITIIGVVLIIISALVSAIKFIKSGKAIQIANIEEWLLYATAMAEKELGSGTGKLKLRYVYDMFVVKFPWLAKMITFEQFSSMVDKALSSMNNLLASNNAVQTYINGKNGGDSE